VAAPTDPADRTEAAPAGTASPAPTSAPTAVPPPATPDGDVAAANSDAPLPVGVSTTLGQYIVAVTAVDADVAVTVDLAAAGSPEPDNGRYVLVELTATYTGPGTGDVHMDMVTSLAGGDGQEYYTHGECAAQLPTPSMLAPPLAPGESTSWQTCLDVTPGSLEGASLFVSELTAEAETRGYWQLG
jgi:hypothetical protein